MELIRFQHASHRFPDGAYGIKNINLTITQGEFIVIAGRNGAGKTVLIKHINGLLIPTEGEVFFKNKPIREQQREIKKKIGLIFQNPDAQIVCPTVREELAFGPENLNCKRAEIEKRIKKVTHMMGLEKLIEKRTSVLSGGEKRKISIAAVITMEPEVIVLDEPFIGLDYEAIRETLRQIVQLHNAGHTLIVISHEVEKILAHACRLVIINRGEAAADGKPADLIGSLESFGIKNPLGAYNSCGDLTWLD
jgi:biotin transport system ATP-binding protein